MFSKRHLHLLFFVLISLLLVLIYPAESIFTGNQYIYFFWGMKDAGFGYLANDFLAFEPNPYPLFSFIVTFTEKYLSHGFYHFWFWLICLIYVFSLFGIARKLFKGKKEWSFWLTFTALFLAIHSTPIWSFFMRYFIGTDLRWIRLGSQKIIG